MMEPMPSATTLSLYAFQPASYGTQFFVLAASRLDAIEAVRKHARQHALDSLWADSSDEARSEAVDEALAEVDTYVNETRDEWAQDGDKPPRIEVWGVGQVVRAEIC
jgi:hypothetical protein